MREYSRMLDYHLKMINLQTFIDLSNYKIVFQMPTIHENTLGFVYSFLIINGGTQGRAILGFLRIISD